MHTLPQSSVLVLGAQRADQGWAVGPGARKEQASWALTAPLELLQARRGPCGFPTPPKCLCSSGFGVTHPAPSQPASVQQVGFLVSGSWSRATVVDCDSLCHLSQSHSRALCGLGGSHLAFTIPENTLPPPGASLFLPLSQGLGSMCSRPVFEVGGCEMDFDPVGALG